MAHYWQWIKDFQDLWWWLGALSVVTFVLTLVITPILVALIPADFFVRREAHRALWAEKFPVLYYSFRVLKNLIGSVLIPAGLVMMILPGPGLIAIIIGLMLVDFPGKITFVRWLVRKETIHQPINTLRVSLNRPPLMIPEQPLKPD